MGYGKGFFKRRQRVALASAERLAPMLVEALSGGEGKPRSMLDIGCGDGSWLRAFRAAGVECVVGIDGPWSPASEAIKCDFERLEAGIFPPLPQARFDFVLTLEFFEHLTPRAAERLVAWTAELTDTVIFSAATPGQGGTGHINEQWIAYWADLFALHGFRCCDFIRPSIWGDAEIAPWYRQNLVGFFRPDVPERIAGLAQAAWQTATSTPLNLVQHEIFARGFCWKTRQRLGV